jgi:hypothetical protein
LWQWAIGAEGADEGWVSRCTFAETERGLLLPLADTDADGP